MTPRYSVLAVALTVFVIALVQQHDLIVVRDRLHRLEQRPAVVQHTPGSPDYNPGLHARVGDPDPDPDLEDLDEEGCLASHGGFICTRAAGHSLQHIASDGTRVVATWWDKR